MTNFAWHAWDTNKGCVFSGISRECTHPGTTMSDSCNLMAMTTMTMTHPNEVSTKCRLALRTRMERSWPQQKCQLMLWEACRSRACDQFMLNDRWALTRVKSGRVWIHEFTVLGPEWGQWPQMCHIQQRHFHWGSVHVTGWLFLVSNTFTVIKILSRSHCSCTGIRQTARIRNLSRSRCRCFHQWWSRLSRTSCSCISIRQTARIRNRPQYRCRWCHRCWSPLSPFSCSWDDLSRLTTRFPVSDSSTWFCACACARSQRRHPPRRIPSGSSVAAVLKLFLNPVGAHEVLVQDDAQRGDARSRNSRSLHNTWEHQARKNLRGMGEAKHSINQFCSSIQEHCCRAFVNFLLFSPILHIFLLPSSSCCCS